MPENGVFQCLAADSLALLSGERCLAELDYGLDSGTVLALCSMHDGASGNEKMPTYRVVRKLTPDDEARMKERELSAQKAKKAFMLSTAREKGHVKILHVRFSYGGERLFIRYSAQMPVDLRRFVGQLQRDFKTHVDLWQVGVRDEAAFIGCLGPCGRAVCCCSWQRQFQPSNVRMAKAQEMSLNPAAINGTCSRLKCCLRFEYEQYRAAGDSLPEHGSTVRCREHDNAEGVVVGRDVMRGRLTVRTGDGRFLTVAATAVTVAKPAARRDEEKEGTHEDSSGEWT
jgi:cell fate regulator YaaT (PSP1 superfamily)